MGACRPPPPASLRAVCPAAGRRRWQLLLPRELLGLELLMAAGCLVLGSGWTELPPQGSWGCMEGCPLPCPLSSGPALPSRSVPCVQVSPSDTYPLPLALGSLGERGEETGHQIKS